MPARATRKQLTEWSHAVRDRAHGLCEICSSDHFPNAHHIFPKRYYPTLALDLDNGICLCAKHHQFGILSAHRDPIGFSMSLSVNPSLQGRTYKLYGKVLCFIAREYQNSYPLVSSVKLPKGNHVVDKGTEYEKM